MAKAGLDKNSVIIKAAELANRNGLGSLSMKELAQSAGVQPPSLYNHIGSLAELQRELMLFGWREMEQRILRAAAGFSGYEALREMCRAFYRYATENPGVFEAMLWYNKYSDSAAMGATENLFGFIYRFTESAGISREAADHLIRTLRGFLEGFSLLVNNGAFGHSADINESFELSLDILIAGMKTLEGNNGSYCKTGRTDPGGIRGAVHLCRLDSAGSGTNSGCP